MNADHPAALNAPMHRAAAWTAALASVAFDVVSWEAGRLHGFVYSEIWRKALAAVPNAQARSGSDLLHSVVYCLSTLRSAGVVLSLLGIAFAGVSLLGRPRWPGIVALVVSVLSLWGATIVS